MNAPILAVSERGQITIPKKVRRLFKVKYFLCEVKNEKIVLAPLKTRDDFLKELDEAEADWRKNGGTTLQKMKKKYPYLQE